MSINSCRLPDSQPSPPTGSRRRTCQPLPRDFKPEVNHGSLATDLSAAAVVARIHHSGYPMREIVRPYAVTTHPSRLLKKEISSHQTTKNTQKTHSYCLNF